MDLLSSNAVRVYIIVFLVLFCGGLVPRVEGQRIIKVANRGDNITLSCYPPRDACVNDYCWYKGSAAFAYFHGDFQQYDSRITQSFIANHSQSNSQYNLHITDVTYYDSATYQCYHGYNGCVARDEGYDLRVIGCSCIVTDQINPEFWKVLCKLLNYMPPSVPRGIRNVIVTINKNAQILAPIDGNDFSFSISRSELNSSLKVELSPYDDVMANIVCTVPAHFISPQTSTYFHTSSPTPTTWNRRSASPTASEELTTREPTKQHTPQKKNSTLDNQTGNGNVTLIIAILGSVFTFILIVIIIAMRCKKTKNRQKSKPNRNVSINNQVVTEEQPEGDYEPIEDESRKEPEYSTSIEMLRKGNKDDKDADCLSVAVSTANVPHDYMALITTSSRSTENETTDDQTCDMAEYVNSSIRNQPKWKGVSPKPENQYDDVSIPERRDVKFVYKL